MYTKKANQLLMTEVVKKACHLNALGSRFFEESELIRISRLKNDLEELICAPVYSLALCRDIMSAYIKTLFRYENAKVVRRYLARIVNKQPMLAMYIAFKYKMERTWWRQIDWSKEIIEVLSRSDLRVLFDALSREIKSSPTFVVKTLLEPMIKRGGVDFILIKILKKHSKVLLGRKSYSSALYRIEKKLKEKSISYAIKNFFRNIFSKK